MSVDRFQQSRKDALVAVEPMVKSTLAHFYGVSHDRVANAEHVRESERGGNSDYIITDFVDYAGVDWIVDERPAFIPVGERLRPNIPGRRDLSIRVENGVGPPCERDRIAAGLDFGLAPQALLYGWYSDESLDRAWILDTAAVWSALEHTDAGEVNQTGDGTAARYIPVDVLGDHDCILDSWDFQAGSGGSI